MKKSELNQYDTYIVAFSGGKDSIACFLHLLDLGIPKSKIELWHHLIDGNEGSTLMDWPVTEDYCRKFAQAFGVPIYFSWKQGGFEKEMTRYDELTAPTSFQFPDDDNIIECGIAGGTRGVKSTRLKFPQVSADLKVRWCSAYLKIDVCTMAVNNQKRFHNSKTLILSGERAEESSARAKYKEFEPDRSDNRTGKTKRHVDRWRPVHKWTEAQVWDIFKKYKVNPHPAYKLGWGRLSCMFCIFGSANQFASAKKVDDKRFSKLVSYEQFFSVSIKRKKYLPELVAAGEPYKSITSELMKQARAIIYDEPIIVDHWQLPAGAFGESTGPT